LSARARIQIHRRGNELTGNDAAMLADEFKNRTNEKDAVLKTYCSRKMRSRHETWKLDLTQSPKSWRRRENDVRHAQSTGSGKLTKAYTKNGKQYGAFQIDFELAIAKLGAGATAVALDKGSKAKLSVRFDGCIDGGSNNGVMETTMEMKMSGALTTPNGVEVKIDGNMKKRNENTRRGIALAPWRNFDAPAQSHVGLRASESDPLVTGSVARQSREN